jgi:hypothetical protein
MQQVDSGRRAREHNSITGQYDKTIGKLVSFLCRKCRAKCLAIERGETKSLTITVPSEEKTHRAMTQPTPPVIKDRVHLFECPGCGQFGKSGGKDENNTADGSSDLLTRPYEHPETVVMHSIVLNMPESYPYNLSQTNCFRLQLRESKKLAQ